MCGCPKHKPELSTGRQENMAPGHEGVTSMKDAFCMEVVPNIGHPNADEHTKGKTHIHKSPFDTTALLKALISPARKENH